MVTLISKDIEDSYIWEVGKTLWDKCSHFPMDTHWESLPVGISNYLDLLYAQFYQSYTYNTLYRHSKEQLNDDGSALVGFSGGKDGLAAALKLQHGGYDVTLFHLSGLNRAWPDEERWALNLASKVGMPIVIRHTTIKGKSSGFIEVPVKNQIIMIAMLSYSQYSRSKPSTFSLGTVRWDTLVRMNSMLNLSDALEINQAAAEFFASIYPQFKYLTVLEHETESLRIITEAGYLNDVHGCMSQLRYRKQLQDAYRRKVGIDPLPGRCGTSCSKCASEIVMLEAQGLLPKGHQAALELSATYLRAIASREHPDVDPKEIISATLGPLGEVYEP